MIEEQEKVVKILEETDTSLFLTGRAGTGKSYIVREFMKTTKKKYVCLAPTGVAAINVGGQTINSFFRIFSHGVYDPEECINKLKEYGPSQSFKDLFNSIQVMIIDEVSMVRVDMIHTMDMICRFLREDNKPFGGIQLLLVGDLFQLPPVIQDVQVKNYLLSKYSSIYFFSSPGLLDYIKRYKLKHIFRQDGEEFKTLLNNVREGLDLKLTLPKLNSRVLTPPEIENMIVVAGTNSEVDSYNQSYLSKTENPQFDYEANIFGKVSESAYPADRVLSLKVGAQIMMLVNDSTGRWVNGSIGKVTELKERFIKVKIDNKEYAVEPYLWETVKYEYDKGSNRPIPKVEGTFMQYPIRLAWAVTIHKSQGQTYDAVYIKLKRAFDCGQTYVALSRCKTFENLYLENPIKFNDVRVDEVVKEFMK